MAQDWDQLADESLVEYRRFCAFMSLGPTRTLDRAYRHYCKRLVEGDEAPARGRQAPGNWHDNCRKNRWYERALAWDVSRLKANGNRAAVLYYHLLETLAAKAIRHATRRDVTPASDEWPQLVATARAIGQRLPGEAAEAAEAFVKVVDLTAGAPAPSG